MSVSSIARIALAAGLVLCLYSPSPAADPDEVCAAKKMRAVAKSVMMRLNCIAKGTTSLDFDPEPCLARAPLVLATAFAKAEAAADGECPTEGDAGAMEEAVQDLVDEAALSIFP
jgi:hypothetical protein